MESEAHSLCGAVGFFTPGVESGHQCEAPEGYFSVPHERGATPEIQSGHRESAVPLRAVRDGARGPSTASGGDRSLSSGAVRRDLQAEEARLPGSQDGSEIRPADPVLLDTQALLHRLPTGPRAVWSPGGSADRRAGSGRSAGAGGGALASDVVLSRRWMLRLASVGCMSRCSAIR